MKFLPLATLAITVFSSALNVAAQRKTLEIYFVDVEGGQATLFVTPEHESLLIDAGWADHDSRDAKRIVAVSKLAGLNKIDYAIITHYHEDHVGGVPQLLALLPVETFIDHGDLYERCRGCVSGFNAYVEAVKSKGAKRMTASAGQALPLRSLGAEVVSSNGEVISEPLSGAGANNSFCETSEIRPTDTTENSHSVGVLLHFGRFSAIDLGDLTWDKERSLMCPLNRIGKVSLLVVSHHGWYQSSSPAYVEAVQPQVAIMDNGATKGGSLPTVKLLDSMSGSTATWQLHRSEEAGKFNVPDGRIANLQGNDSSDVGNYLKISASEDGSFTVYNSRTGKTVAYPAR